MRNGVGQLGAETIAVFAYLNDMGGKLGNSERRHHTDRPPIERRKQQEHHQFVSSSLHDPASILYQVSLGAATDDYSWMQHKRIPPGFFSTVQATYEDGGHVDPRHKSLGRRAASSAQDF